MDREDFFQGKDDIFSGLSEDEWETSKRGVNNKKPPHPTHNHHFVVTLPCSNACVVVLMKAGLPISWSTHLGLQVSFPYTQCNFLSWCSVPFGPETCRVEWHCWGQAQPWCMWVKSAVPPAVGDRSLVYVAAGSDIHGFLRCLTACATGCIGEQCTLSSTNISDSFHAYKLCLGHASLPTGLFWLPVHLLCRVGCMLLQGVPKMRGVPCESAICGNLRLRTRREESPEKLPYYEALRKGLGRRLLLYRLNEEKKFPSTAVFGLLYASEFFLVLK